MKQQHVVNNTSNGMAYLKYLYLIFDMFNFRPTSYLCQVNRAIFLKTGELTHSQQFKAAIREELKGCCFITTLLYEAHNYVPMKAEEQNEYRRYILRRFIGAEQLRINTLVG